MNAVDLLKQDHDVVDTLFKQAEDTTPSRQRGLFTKIKGELDTHAHIEETIVYPALLKKGNKKLVDIVKEGIEEHRQMKMFLKELGALTPKNDKFEPKLKVLIEDTRHHVKEEENEMFPMVERQFTSTALTEMGERMEAEKKRFQKANGIKPVPPKKSAIGAVLDKAMEAVTTAFTGADTPGRSTAKGKPKGSGSKAATARSRSAATATANGSKKAPTGTSGKNGASKKAGAAAAPKAKTSTAAKKKTASSSKASAGK